MTDDIQHDTSYFQEQANVRHEIERKITHLFAPEDMVLQQCLAAAKDEDYTDGFTLAVVLPEER